MIKAEFSKKNGNIVKIVVKGHSGYSDEGSDIVCASVSSVAFMSLNGIEKLLGLNFGYETGDGYLYFVLPDDIDKKDLERANILLKSFLLYINDLKEQYPEFIEVTELEV